MIAVATWGCGRSGFESHADANGADADPNAPDADLDHPDSRPMANCPGNYVSAGEQSSRYRYIMTTSTWTAAEATCEGDGAGIHLAVFDDGIELAALRSVVGDTDVWTGVTDRITEGSYLSVTGLPAPFLPWSNGEPTGAAEDCVSVEVDDGVAGDADCALLRRPLCECDGIAIVPGSY